MSEKNVTPVGPPVTPPPKTSSPIAPRNLKAPPLAKSTVPSIGPADPEKAGEKDRLSDVKTDSTVSESSPSTILSDKTLNDWRGSVTTFPGFTGTRPALELTGVPWADVENLLRPDKPAILTDKKHGVYFVPCELKNAPLVGKTLEAAKNNGSATTGKMRSKCHVTEASLLVMDVDGLPEEELNAGLEKIKLDGITYLAFTTHSYGNPDKPGMRVRIVIPLNRPVTIEEYSSAWHGVDQQYFDGQAGKADSSGANMYQQQGTWVCHPDRVEQAKSWRHSTGVVRADVLIEAGRAVVAPQPAMLNLTKAKNDKPVSSTNADSIRNTDHTASTFSMNTTYPASDANKVADACQQIRTFRENKGVGQSEPLWYDCLGIVIHCSNGAAISQKWSSGHHSYDTAETERKYLYRIKTPPTTCRQFRKSNPAGCNGCVQTCNSPITLGREPVDELATIQQLHTLIKMDGKFFVVDGNSLNELTEQGLAKKLELSNPQDGKLLLMRTVKALFPHADASAIANQFFLSPQTICFRGVEFKPNGTSENYLNLWVGPTIHPKSGQWGLIQAFLLDVICNGEQEVYSYLIKYIAHALQRPEEKPGVMIIMVGGQGIGKGTLGRILQRIWSATYIQINNIDAVTGNFNASLERTFIVFMDEALFSGNRRASDMLKSLVTEPIIQINEKYQPSRQIRSYHRFIAATNANHFKNTERDDRRDFTLRVSDVRKGDHAYWAALNHEIENDGAEALTHDLLAMDLSSFNVRDKPNTEEFQEQKLLSLGPIPRWWHDCLFRGSIGEADDWQDFIKTSAIIDNVVEIAGGRIYQKPAAITVAKEMLKLCPSAKKMQKQEQFGRSRGYSLPSLQQARAEFEKYIGGTVEWDDSVSHSLEE